MRNVVKAVRVSGKADLSGARKICIRKVVSPTAGLKSLFLAKMMSIASRSGAFSPYLQATKHTVKSVVFSGAKELVPVAGKAEKRRGSTLAISGAELRDIP